MIGLIYTRVIPLFLGALLAGCGSLPSSTSSSSDSAPRRNVDVTNIPEVVPRQEEVVRRGNISPYSVFGETYEVMDSSRGYRETGYASWYGTKFHGRLTSNGEVYDMFQITAAHKTLPIPAYVLVRNLENGKELIVRVNDRGPFHDERIIDLSWAAASKLGYADSGVAHVEVIALDPNDYQRTLAQLAAENNPTPELEPELKSEPIQILSEPVLTHLQIAALSNHDNAWDLGEKVAQFTDVSVQVVSPTLNSDLYRVVVGPVSEISDIDTFRTLLELNGLPSGFLIDFESVTQANCMADSNSPIC